MGYGDTEIELNLFIYFHNTMEMLQEQLSDITKNITEQMSLKNLIIKIFITTIAYLSDISCLYCRLSLPKFIIVACVMNVY